ncbi:MAG: ATP-dependent Clp protease ATP-binding subunit [Bacilli bacterium]|nr:ATP-dependent Clp protease ATP-binding subunit [Bacilli bacterium]
MDLNEQFDKKVKENFDIKSKRISMLDNYGENFCNNDYITNPAIGRDLQIKELILILLTPEKSAVLIGKPGVGKTAIVEGLAYRIKKGEVPDILKNYQVIKLNTAALLGTDPVTGESKVQTLIDELKDKTKLILFIDEIHTLMGTKGEALDFANMFKPALDRGDIKVIGATTTEEYERYILRDKAFVRRFQKVEVLEPTKEENIEILMGTLPKMENKTGVKMKYTSFIQRKIMEFITEITSEYKRIYEIGSRYPDVSLTIVQQAFSNALFDNRFEVNIIDFRKAIISSKNIYPDVIKKSMPQFDLIFKDQIQEVEKEQKKSYERLSDDTVI